MNIHCKAIIQMTHKGRVAHFRLHPPKMGSNFTEYKRGLTYENAKPMSVKGSVGYSAFRAGQLNRKAKEKKREQSKKACRGPEGLRGGPLD